MPTTRLLARTRLEDDLTREYRGLVAELPLACVVDDTSLDTLLGVDPDLDAERDLGVFYRYFDLSNQQLYLCGLAVATATEGEGAWRLTGRRPAA